MIKPVKFLFFLFFIPFVLTAQVRATEDKVEEILIQFENAEVDIVELRTMKKWKALELSHEMKSQMDYNIIRVKYNAKGKEHMVIIDLNLVPIRYDYLSLSD